MAKRAGAIMAIVGSATGGAVAIALMELLSTHANYPLMMVPFATSIVLVMGSPGAEPAQPRALVGGHVISAIVGLVVAQILGPATWTAALAVGLAMAAMLATHTFHPPAGINPLVIVTYNLPWTFLIAPVGIGVLLLVTFSFAWHGILARARGWPPHAR